MSVNTGLVRRSVGAGGLWFFAVSASAPMTALVGGVVTSYAHTGVVGMPVSFLLLTAVLWLLTVGYVAMNRYVAHAASFYSLLALGLGRAWGVAGGLVAMVGYNAVEIALYGLLGATLAGDLGGPWWGPRAATAPMARLSHIWNGCANQPGTRIPHRLQVIV